MLQKIDLGLCGRAAWCGRLYNLCQGAVPATEVVCFVSHLLASCLGAGCPQLTDLKAEQYRDQHGDRPGGLLLCCWTALYALGLIAALSFGCLPTSAHRSTPTHDLPSAGLPPSASILLKYHPTTAGNAHHAPSPAWLC